MVTHEFTLTMQWRIARNDAPEIINTCGYLTISVGKHCLTRNEDAWSRTTRESVYVSAYPLAIWFASSWWRLHYEPLPAAGITPSLDWKMAHEIGAAGHGYVWPKITIATDNEAIQVWADTSRGNSGNQSLAYIGHFPHPLRVTRDAFSQAVEQFIESCIARLEAANHAHNDLARLWELIQADRADKERSRLRIIEAQLGYEPQERGCSP